MTGQVSETTNQTAQAANQFSQKAEQLRDLVGRFKVKVADRRHRDVGTRPGAVERRLEHLGDQQCPLAMMVIELAVQREMAWRFDS